MGGPALTERHIPNRTDEGEALQIAFELPVSRIVKAAHIE